MSPSNYLEYVPIMAAGLPKFRNHILNDNKSVLVCGYTQIYLFMCIYQHPPNYPLRDPKYHLIETIRPLIEVHWGVLVYIDVYIYIWEFPKIGGPQYRPQNTIVLIIGTPKKEPLILGSPHMCI